MVVKRNSVHNLEAICSQVRRDIVRMVNACQSGHPGGSLGCTELLVALYFEAMERNDHFDIDGYDEDLFFLSNGHISPVFYSVLARCGYFDVAELSTFRKLNSRLQGHPTTHEGLPGVRIASGSLGQGLSVSIGAAQAKKLNNDSHLIYVLMGDGELQEGQVWEAALYAPHNKIDNLIAIVDYNGAQIDGATKDVLSLGDLRSKWKAFGWQVIEVLRGNHIPSVLEGLSEAKALAHNKKPIIILLHTEMGNGVDFMMGSHKWHGIAPNSDQLQDALAQNAETLGDF